MPEPRVSAGDVTFDPSAPALPQPEVQPPELERIGCQLAQGDADRAAAGAISSEENARSEIVSVPYQAAVHCLQQLVREMLECPSCSARQLCAYTAGGETRTDGRTALPVPTFIFMPPRQRSRCPTVGQERDCYGLLAILRAYPLPARAPIVFTLTDERALNIR